MPAYADFALENKLISPAVRMLPPTPSTRTPRAQGLGNGHNRRGRCAHLFSACPKACSSPHASPFRLPVGRCVVRPQLHAWVRLLSPPCQLGVRLCDLTGWDWVCALGSTYCR